MRALPFVLLLGSAAPAHADQVQADLGLTVIALGYEQPVSDHAAVQLEAGTFGTYFLPWFDAGDKITGVIVGARATWFQHTDGKGLYITPYIRSGWGRGKHEDGDGVSGDAGAFTAGGFVGWALRPTDKIDLRLGVGAQYIYLSGEHGLEASTPMFALDFTLGVSLVKLAVLLVLCAATPAFADRPLIVDVDIREAPRKLIKSHLVIPVKPGKVRLRYAKWIPGEHIPSGPVGQTSLKLSVRGKPIAWTRDPVDMYLVTADVPAGTTDLEADLDYALDEHRLFTAHASATAALDVLAWNAVVWYPDGPTSDAIRVKPSIRIPAGWKLGTALPGMVQKPDRIEFAETTLTTLVDSPVLSGVYTKEVVLLEQPKVRVFIAADSEAAIAVSDDTFKSWKRIANETYALFGARHYKAYTFLLTLSDRVPPYGLEHHESSDDRVSERILTDDTARPFLAELFAHEHTHSWNGKFRRPVGLAAGHYDQPMQTEGLLVYEGLTMYLGFVIAARAGGMPDAASWFGLTTAGMALGTGRTWRPLADTAVASQLTYVGAGWDSRIRNVDFYGEGALFWLEVDATIRKLTKGQRSLDDFCKAFFGVQPDVVGVVPYTLDDIYATLDKIAPYDWKGLARKRLFEVAPSTADGLTASGWRVIWKTEESPAHKTDEANFKYSDLRFSLGLLLDPTGAVGDVIPGTTADRAGLAPGMKIVAVSGRSYEDKRMREALASKSKSVEVIVTLGDTYKVVRLDASSGPRYPWVERIPAAEDLMTKILAPRTK